VASRRFLTAEEGVRSMGSSCDICSGHCVRFLSMHFAFLLLIVIPHLSDIYLSIARGMQSWLQFQETYFTAAQGGDECKMDWVVVFISQEI